MNPTVLYFHHIGSGIDHYTSVARDVFERMLDCVQAAGEIVDLADVLAETSAQDGSNRRFVLTFDDGYADVFGDVVEGLHKRGIPATFFVVPSWVGSRAPHPWAPDDLRCADADELREAQRLGFGIASHTWSHARLDLCSSDEVSAQLDRSAEWLNAEGLGASLEGVVAYPYGRAPAAPATRLRAAFGTGRKPVACWRCRRYDISRVYLAADDEQNWKERIDGWFRAGLDARRQCDRADHW